MISEGCISLSLVDWAMLLALASGLPSFFASRLGRPARLAQVLSVAVLLLGCALGFAGALIGLVSPPSASYFLPWPNGGEASIGLDALSSFFLLLLFFVAALASLYSLGYEKANKHPARPRSYALFLGLLVAGMSLLLLARHALAFLLGWEAMALSAFFLMLSGEPGPESRRASFIYLAATHAGTLALFAMFAFWGTVTGSLDLSAHAVSAGAAWAIVLLALFGFGIKAGIMPLHFWLPAAHASAPSYISALLSGVMLKMGIYGILRMLSLIPALPEGIGWLILVLGLVSALGGVAFALAQRDLKRLLAYCSVENIGIILIALALGLLGRSWSRPDLFVIGLGACLLQTWNHGLSKSLLFMGAGSVYKATGSKRMDLLGGLSKALPWTTASFAIASLAICALPPCNGFVSEFLIYLGLFGGPGLSPLAGHSSAMGSSLLLVGAPCLALVGALALVCFVKALSSTFLGQGRSQHAARARGREASPVMLLPMLFLAFLCLAIGLVPQPFAHAADAAVKAFNAGLAPSLALSGSGTPAGSESSPGLAALPQVSSLAPLAWLGMADIALCLLAGIAWLAIAGKKGRARQVPTWDCGYAAPTARMQYTGSSFSRELVSMGSALLKPSAEPGRIHGLYPEASRLSTEVEDLSMRSLVRPATRLVTLVSRQLRRFQQGLTQAYILYIAVALALLLLTLLPLAQLVARAAGN